MPSSAPTTRTTPSDACRLNERVKSVGDDLLATMGDLLEAIPGSPHRPTRLARRLGLSRVILSRVLGAVECEDPSEALERFLEATTPDIPVVAGIWPFLSLRNAEFLANEMPGVDVSAETVDRMRKAEASGPEAAVEEGVAIALEMIEGVRPLVQGFHLSAPHRRVDVPLRVLRESGVRTTA